MNSFELRIYIPDVFLNPFSQFTKTAIYAIYNTIELFTLLTLLLLYKTAASYTTYNTIQYNTKQLLTLRLLTPPGPGGVRPYMGNIGMYGPKVWFFSRFGHKSLLDSSLIFGFFRRSYFFITPSFSHPRFAFL